jgi:hypothetical protein
MKCQIEFANDDVGTPCSKTAVAKCADCGTAIYHLTTSCVRKRLSLRSVSPNTMWDACQNKSWAASAAHHSRARHARNAVENLSASGCPCCGSGFWWLGILLPNVSTVWPSTFGWNSYPCAQLGGLTPNLALSKRGRHLRQQPPVFALGKSSYRKMANIDWHTPHMVCDSSSEYSRVDKGLPLPIIFFSCDGHRDCQRTARLRVCRCNGPLSHPRPTGERTSPFSPA